MPLIINGQIIPEQVLNNELLRQSAIMTADAPQAVTVDPAALRTLALRNMVTRTLLLQMAAARRFRVTDAEAEAERARRWRSVNNTFCGTGVREAIVEDLLVDRVSAELTRHVSRPGRAEAEEFYRRNLRRYFLPEAVHAAHIVCNLASPADEPAARVVLEQAEYELSQGKIFSQVADRYSDCKGVGGSIGWVSRGQMVPGFENVVFSLQAGKRSGIFCTVFGLHIATVIKKRSAGYSLFEEVRLEIASQILAERRRSALAQTVATMEQASQIYFTEETAGA